MKWVALAACLVVGVSVLSERRLAADPTTAPTTAPMAAVNKTCPVSHEAVDPKIPTVTYKGMVIGFCCPDCVKAFNADPDKYVANLK